MTHLQCILCAGTWGCIAFYSFCALFLCKLDRVFLIGTVSNSVVFSSSDYFILTTLTFLQGHCVLGCSLRDCCILLCFSSAKRDTIKRIVRKYLSSYTADKLLIDCKILQFEDHFLSIAICEADANVKVSVLFVLKFVHECRNLYMYANVLDCQ